MRGRSVDASGVYAVALLVGVAVPLSQFIPWAVEHGPDLRLFHEQMFANRISSFFVYDVVITVVVLWCAVAFDRRLPTRDKAVVVVASLLGASVGWPLYLWLHARSRTASPPAST